MLQGKTEALPFQFFKTSRSTYISVHLPTTITFSDSVRNLGFYLDKDLSMKENKSISFARQLSLNFAVSALFDIIFQLTPLKLLLFHFYSFGLTICNSLLAGISLSKVSKLQRIQNCAARLVVRASSSIHVIPILKQLHWLLIKTRISYKIACLCFNPINSSTPAYFCDLLHLQSPSRSLRSSDDTCLLKIPLYKCKTKSDRAFNYSGPSVWNSLQLEIRNATTTDTFKSALKTHLFNLQDFD